MKKEDLKVGNVVEAREGTKFLICNINDTLDMIRLNGKSMGVFDLYDNNLKYDEGSCWDIVKVYEDYTLQEVLWERQEIPKLTEDEKVILRNINKDYKWIARDKSSLLYIYGCRPSKGYEMWKCDAIYKNLIAFSHIFQSIQWDDNAPHLISDLLGE